jgi:hypothetical protein
MQAELLAKNFSHAHKTNKYMDAMNPQINVITVTAVTAKLLLNHFAKIHYSTGLLKVKIRFSRHFYFRPFEGQRAKNLIFGNLHDPSPAFCSSAYERMMMWDFLKWV